MKKIFLMFAMLLFSVSLVWATPTIVNGKVYSGPTTASPPVVGATVDVTCGLASGFDVTDGSGEYFIGFDSGCSLGDTAESCVGTICNSAEVTDELLPNEINIVGVDIFNVPEFSVITALVALAGATVVFVVVRKRN